MSRSYKKTPGFLDGSCSKKYYKRLFAKKVRRHVKLSNGSSYKRISGANNWDICDWKSLYYSKNEVLRAIEEHNNPPEYKWYRIPSTEEYKMHKYEYYMK